MREEISATISNNLSEGRRLKCFPILFGRRGKIFIQALSFEMESDNIERGPKNKRPNYAVVSIVVSHIQ